MPASAAPRYCVGLITPASLAGGCVEPMSRAQCPRQFGGVERSLFCWLSGIEPDGEFAPCPVTGLTWPKARAGREEGEDVATCADSAHCRYGSHARRRACRRAKRPGGTAGHRLRHRRLRPPISIPPRHPGSRPPLCFTMRCTMRWSNRCPATIWPPAWQSPGARVRTGWCTNSSCARA